MYVERGMEEIMRLKMEMGESIFFSSGFGFGENEIFGFSLFLRFELCFLRAENFGFFFFFFSFLIMPVVSTPNRPLTNPWLLT